jgi:hypothetical protein
MRFVQLLLLLLCACGPRDGESGGRQDAPAFGIPIPQADLAAYRMGRLKEIDVLRGGARLTGARLDSIGAAGAGLPLEQYRAVLGAVDRYLRDSMAHLNTDSGPPLRLDPMLAQLDSLRAERIVLELRLAP